MTKAFLNRRGVVVLALSLSFFGCAENDFYGEEVEADCGRLIDGPCDIRKLGCQRDLFQLVMCARGAGSGVFPQVETIDSDEFVKVLLEPSESDQDDSIEAKAWTKAFQLLGLLPEEVSLSDATSEELAEEVAGFYLTDSRSLFVIDFGEPMNSRDMNLTMMHEMVHALQDQTVGLDAFEADFVTSTDTAFAVRALIEGEATHFMLVALSLMDRRDPRDLNWKRYYDSLLDLLNEEIQTSKAPFASAFSMLPYALGGRYVTDAWLAGGSSEVESLFERPITTAVQWMLDYESAPIALESLACALPRAPQGVEALGSDRLGAVAIYALMLQNEFATESAWELAKKWRGGEIAVYAAEKDEQAPTLVAWRTAWENEDDASRLAEGLRDNDFITSKRALQRREKEVLITAADQPDALQTWMEDSECIRPEEDQKADQPNALIRAILPRVFARTIRSSE
ncbi:MAG: hypothetical protein JXA30_07050 [Deltaproteobacteria bacterium]|nr:hypothetical protein [Deltaproteobacteria bacterium]